MAGFRWYTGKIEVIARRRLNGPLMPEAPPTGGASLVL